MENITESEETLSKEADWEPDISSGSSLHILEIWVMSTYILKFFICLINISASIFLMVIIMRFRKLRTRVNIYIFHYALNNALYYLTEPLLNILFLILSARFDKVLFCCLDEVDDSCLVLMYIFAIVAAIDYYSTHLRSSLLFWYKNMYTYFIFMLYSIGLIKYLFTIIFCFSKVNYIRHYFLIACFIIVFVIINVINVIEFKERKKTKQDRVRYPIIIANLIVWCWLPLFVYDICIEYFHMQTPLGLFFTYTEFAAQFLAHGHGVIVVYMLGRLNKDYKMGYMIALKRRFRNYEHNDLDQAEEETVPQEQPQMNRNDNDNDKCQDNSADIDTDEAFAEIALR